MSEPMTTELVPYAQRFYTQEAYASLQELGAELVLAAFELMKQMTLEPERFRQRSIRASKDGGLLYKDHDTRLEITFQIDDDKKEVCFFNFSAPRLTVSKTIFVSYSHKDFDWFRRIRDALSILEQLGLVEFWSDEEIESATEWRKEIEGRLQSARAAVLLVSDYFLTSSFISEVELPAILEGATRESKEVFWIHLAPSKVDEFPGITKFQALSRNPKLTLVDLLRRGEDELGKELAAIRDRLARVVRLN